MRPSLNWAVIVKSFGSWLLMDQPVSFQAVPSRDGLEPPEPPQPAATAASASASSAVTASTAGRARSERAVAVRLLTRMVRMVLIAGLLSSTPSAG